MVAAAGLLAATQGANAADSGSFNPTAGTHTLATSIGNFSVIFAAAGSTNTAACAYIPAAGDGGQGCGKITVDWTFDAPSNTLDLDFTSSASFGLLAGQIGKNAHLYLNFTVQAPTAKKIDDVSLSLVANAKGTSGTPSITNTYATEYLCSSALPSTCQGSGYFASLTPSALGAGGATTYDLLAAGQATNSLNVSKDLVSLANGSNSNSGFNITSMAQSYKVPEPVSASLLGAGIGAAAVARRWRRKVAARVAANDDCKVAA